MGFLITTFGYAALIFVLTKLAKAVFNCIYPFIYAVPQNIQVLAGSRWAVITGSTDGIGKAYAFELAKKGFNLVLISRTQSKLDTVAEEIRTRHKNTDVKTIVFDFTDAKLEDYETKIFGELYQIEVGILVNNVGLSYEYPDRIDRIDGGMQRVTDITIINALPATVLSAFVLKQMAERKSGIIVNVASSAGYFPLTFWAIYSASKRYVIQLSEILRKEYAPLGITIQTVCPMMVATKMSKVRKTSFFTPSPEDFVRHAVRSIGHAAETTGCMSHQIQCEFVFGFLPSFLVDKITATDSAKTRIKALKKKEAATKQE